MNSLGDEARSLVLQRIEKAALRSARNVYHSEHVRSAAHHLHQMAGDLSRTLFPDDVDLRVVQKLVCHICRSIDAEPCVCSESRLADLEQCQFLREY